MAVKSKSIYEEATPDDGMRVLTTNYWPRGVSRERAGTYLRAVGPSRDLLRAFRAGEIEWDAYRARYLDEMTGAAQQEEIGRLAEASRQGNVTVMCMCKDETQCHRTLLRELIEEKVQSAR